MEKSMDDDLLVSSVTVACLEEENDCNTVIFKN